MSTSKKSFTFGTDPEFMVYDQKKSKIVSAIPLLKVDKHEKIVKGDYSFYYDNVMVEGTLPPSTGRENTVKNVGGFLKAVSSYLKPHQILCNASHEYDKNELEHPKAKEIGCVSEDDIYTLTTVVPPINKFKEGGLRSAGGHVHVGFELSEDVHARRNLVRLLDFFLGIPSILLDGDPTSARRRELYGQAGRYRTTPYGIEYRSLGNWWLASPETVALVHDLVDEAVQIVSSDRIESIWKTNREYYESNEFWRNPEANECDIYECVGYPVESIVGAINKTDRKKAQKHFNEDLKKYISKELFSRLEKRIEGKKFYGIDVYSQWGL